MKARITPEIMTDKMGRITLAAALCVGLITNLAIRWPD